MVLSILLYIYHEVTTCQENRKKFVSSLANELVEPFNELSKKTRLTKTKLLDEAIEDLLKKYAAKDL